MAMGKTPQHIFYENRLPMESYTQHVLETLADRRRLRWLEGYSVTGESEARFKFTMTDGGPGR